MLYWGQLLCELFYLCWNKCTNLLVKRTWQYKILIVDVQTKCCYLLANLSKSFSISSECCCICCCWLCWNCIIIIWKFCICACCCCCKAWIRFPCLLASASSCFSLISNLLARFRVCSFLSLNICIVSFPLECLFRPVPSVPSAFLLFVPAKFSIAFIRTSCALAWSASIFILLQLAWWQSFQTSIRLSHQTDLPKRGKWSECFQSIPHGSLTDTNRKFQA